MKKLFIAVLLSVSLFACAGTDTGKSRQDLNPAAGKSVTKPSAAEISCYDIGYRWGVCAAKNTEDRSCKPGADAVITENCKDDPMTQQGIKDGVRSIQKLVQ